MAVPTNITPETATAITTFPYNTTENVADAPQGVDYAPSCAPDQYFAVWFTYTAQACDAVIGVLAVKASADVYEPVLSVWTGTPPSLTQLATTVDGTSHNWCDDQDGNFWMQIPVTPGTTYYFQVVSDNSSTPTVNLSFQLKRAPRTSAASGSILVPSDGPGWPATLMSSTDGTILRMLTFPACEQAAILPDNRICVANEGGIGGGATFHDVTSHKIYGTTLNLVATVTSTVSATQSAVVPVSSDRVDTFYVAKTNGVAAAAIKTIGITGTVGGTTWTLAAASSAISGMAPNFAETLLYWVTEAVSGPVYKHDLNTDMPAANLVAGTAGADYGRDVLVQATSGDILTVFRPNASGAPTAWTVKRYDTSGATLATYTLPASLGSAPRIALAADDPTHVWAMTFATADISRFQKIRVSDGVVITDFTVNQRDPGVLGGTANVIFGPAQSCPLLVSRNTIATTNGCEGGVCTIVVEKETDGSDQTTFSFLATNMSPGTFTLADGGSQSFSVAAGTGYGVAEEQTTGWSNAVEVDNGDPVNNITIADGQTVTVTFTNSPYTSTTYPLRRERSFVLPNYQNYRMLLRRLEFLVKSGVGNSDAPAPTLTLNISRDGGETYGADITMELGVAGDYIRRVFVQNLGQYRIGAAKLSTSDPVQIAWLDCFADIEKTNS